MSDFLHNIWQSVIEYWLLFSTIFAAFLMSVFRTAKMTGRIDWLESSMCGLFAWGIWLVLGFFNIPDGAGVIIGGMVGYSGTHLVSKWIGRKLGFNETK